MSPIDMSILTGRLTKDELDLLRELVARELCCPNPDPRRRTLDALESKLWTSEDSEEGERK